MSQLDQEIPVTFEIVLKNAFPTDSEKEVLDKIYKLLESKRRDLDFIEGVGYENEEPQDGTAGVGDFKSAVIILSFVAITMDSSGLIEDPVARNILRAIEQIPTAVELVDIRRRKF